MSEQSPTPFQFEGRNVRLVDLSNSKHSRLAVIKSAIAALEISVLESIARIGADYDANQARSIFQELRLTFQESHHLSFALYFHLGAMRGCEEFDLQGRFFELLDTLLPGAKKIERATDRHHIPGGFVEIDGEVLPVEVKLRAFDDSAVRQLERYISRYKCRRGVAVAASLACDLPPHIIFVQLRRKDWPRDLPKEVAADRMQILSDAERLRQLYSSYREAEAALVSPSKTSDREACQ